MGNEATSLKTDPLAAMELGTDSHLRGDPATQWKPRGPSCPWLLDGNAVLLDPTAAPFPHHCLIQFLFQPLSHSTNF
ncbi:hypothetical protein chiPu_0026069 [Chiloscyllium punctatum]|uniref:Uncharacterized protein n=1 Tax=Chiloscyllium punctatum TaxID=137246 RepID=A0A401THN0_CHIPU|nr:hypothetical protein [Chiloscyllium punctatum]